MNAESTLDLGDCRATASEAEELDVRARHPGGSSPAVGSALDGKCGGHGGHQERGSRDSRLREKALLGRATLGAHTGKRDVPELRIGQISVRTNALRPLPERRSVEIGEGGRHETAVGRPTGRDPRTPLPRSTKRPSPKLVRAEISLRVFEQCGAGAHWTSLHDRREREPVERKTLTLCSGERRSPDSGRRGWLLYGAREANRRR